MKLTLKSLLLCILVLSFFLSSVISRSSRNLGRRASNHGKRANDAVKKSPAGAKSICCKIEKKNQEKKKAGAPTLMHMWKPADQCVSFKDSTRTVTALSKAECDKQKTQKTGRRY